MTALSVLLGATTIVFAVLWHMEKLDRAHADKRNAQLQSRIKKLSDQLDMDSISQKASEWRQEKREGIIVEEDGR